MHIGQALDLVSRYDSLRNPLTSLGDYLDPELISRCLAESGTVTLRKRRLPLEMMVWCIVGMALERKEPLTASDITSHQPVSRKISARHFAGIFQWMTGICTENIPPFNPLTDEDN